MTAAQTRPGAAPAGRSSTFAVTGMTCQGCVRHALEAIQNVPGVASATVSLEQRRATVRWLPQAEPGPAAVVQAIQSAGFQARGFEEEATAPTLAGWSPLAGWKFNVVLGGLVTLALMAGEWVLSLGMQRWFHWLAFGLALPVQVVCGARFYVGAWRQLKAGQSNMDTLVALGSTTAFTYSLWALFHPALGHVYFMESAAIITLISVGHWLEAKASARAASSLRALLGLAPHTARQLLSGGEETVVPVAALVPDDRVLLKPGDRVPTDGEVVEGQSAVDESMLTGESLPLEKPPGAKVYAGTLNQNGRLVVRVTATGEATALAHIIAVVQRAQTSRADIQRLGDRVSSIFVPLVVLVAFGTGLWWGLAYEHASRVHQLLAPFLWHTLAHDSALSAAIIHAAAVLIVACPCAMGLATPAAIMAGANAAARRGILIRDGQALEKSGRINAVLFDKTGTLTEGRVTVAAVLDLRLEADRQPALATAASALAAPSNHPLSRAVAEWAAAHQAAGGSKPGDAAGPAEGVLRAHATDPLAAPTLHDWQEVTGAGVQARLALEPAELQADAPLWLLGSLAWLRDHDVGAEAAAEFTHSWLAQGAGVLGLACGRRLVAVWALRDTPKPHARRVLQSLAAQGHATFLVTGDNPATAAAVATLVGLKDTQVFAGVRPEEKAGLVQTLQQQGWRVAFVGDGINDAPALEQADLGVAVSRASDVAREASDLILLRSDIQAIPEALGLARATLRTIKQNLFWAFFYNGAAVPLAALGFLSPVLCAAAMGLSDVLVLGNALRLSAWGRPEKNAKNAPAQEVLLAD